MPVPVKKARKRKLAVQVGMVTCLIFFATLAYILISDYSITRDAYLSSKNEMIDRDIRTLAKGVKDNKLLPWGLKYWREHTGEMDRGLTAEEQELDARIETEDIYTSCLNGLTDPDTLTPTMQWIIASRLYYGIAVNLANTDELDYSAIQLLGIIDEQKVCLYMDQNTNDFEMYPDDPRDVIIDYPASEHSAVDRILSTGIKAANETFYELYHDPADGKEYYIAYMPVCYEGEERCLLCIRYDWSDFYDQLLTKARTSMIIGLLVMILLNGILTLFLYRKAIAPIVKVGKGVQEYMKDKDAPAAAEKMHNVRAKNEIGVLADHFADLATEIDRYTEEILTLNSEKERISTELALATSIQSSVLPGIFPAFPDRKEFDIYATMNPAKEVGGDFYDFFLIDKDHLCLVIADVSGKGIPAALFMMASMITVRNLAKQGLTPARILTEANEAICANNKEEMFVTVWLGILEISTGKLTASNGGHEYPAILGGSGEFELYKDTHGFVLGGMEGVSYQNYEIRLRPGDKVFVYTDGVPEATNAEEELFGTKRLVQALAGCKDGTPEDILRYVHASVDGFVKSAKQFDDLTMLCIMYKGV